MYEFENTRRVQYESGATFVPKCEKCGRFVKPDKSVWTGDAGLKDQPNATCSRCGRIKMIFEGFLIKKGK